MIFSQFLVEFLHLLGIVCLDVLQHQRDFSFTKSRDLPDQDGTGETVICQSGGLALDRLQSRKRVKTYARVINMTPANPRLSRFPIVKFFMKLLKNSPTLPAGLRGTRASDNRLHRDPPRPCAPTQSHGEGIIMGGQIGLIPKELNVEDGKWRDTAALRMAGIRRVRLSAGFKRAKLLCWRQTNLKISKHRKGALKIGTYNIFRDYNIFCNTNLALDGQDRKAVSVNPVRSPWRGTGGREERRKRPRPSF